MVFVLSEDEEAEWPSDARGATPFDSGGLWWERVVTSPQLDDAGRRAFFRDHDVPLAKWRAAFEEYIRAHYGTVSNYIEGDAPKPEIKSRDLQVTIIRGSPNDKLAWTWEVRIRHDLAADRLALQAAYMTETHRDYYLDWLCRSPLTDDEFDWIHRWVEDHVIVPEQDESVVQAVEDRLALEVTDG